MLDDVTSEPMGWVAQRMPLFLLSLRAAADSAGVVEEDLPQHARAGGAGGGIAAHVSAAGQQ